MAKLAGIDEFPKKLAYLRKIDPFTFGELILEAFKQRGCRVRRNRRYTGDGGVDGQVIINRRLYFIQAKRYRLWIDPRHVKEFSRLVNRRGRRGIFVHTGRTGVLSRAVANTTPNLTIISGQRLIALLTPIQTSSKKSDRSDVSSSTNASARP